MPVNPSSKTIRRLIAKVAGGTPDDIEAVLNLLEPAERQSAERLIADYVGLGAKQGPVSFEPPPAALAQRAGLSPWLATRLLDADPPERTEQARLGAAFAARGPEMTSTARETLRACVAELASQAIDGGVPSEIGVGRTRRWRAPKPRLRAAP
jgi:hypothetical protein